MIFIILFFRSCPALPGVCQQKRHSTGRSVAGTVSAKNDGRRKGKNNRQKNIIPIHSNRQKDKKTNRQKDK